MLVLVYRIVTESSKKLPKIIIGVMTLIALEGVAFILGVMFQCGYVIFLSSFIVSIHSIGHPLQNPVLTKGFSNPSTYWTLSFKPQPSCMSETKNLLAAGIINTIGDLVVVILPIPIIWRLQLPIQQQIIIILLFGAGILVTVASVLRTYYLYQVTNGWDKTWHASPAWITSSVELYVGIVSLSTHPVFCTIVCQKAGLMNGQMCASIPATKKFFSRSSPRLFGTSMPSHQVSHTHTHTSFPSARNSYAIPHDVELGAFSGHGFFDRKDGMAFDAFPAPPRYSHAVNLAPYVAGRPQTPKSATSAQSLGSDGRDDVTRVDSDDELVERYVAESMRIWVIMLIWSVQ